MAHYYGDGCKLEYDQEFDTVLMDIDFILSPSFYQKSWAPWGNLHPILFFLKCLLFKNSDKFMLHLCDLHDFIRNWRISRKPIKALAGLKEDCLDFVPW